LIALAADQPIWRVFKIPHLLSLVRDHCLTLVRPELWDDPFENFLAKCRARLRSTGITVSLYGLFGAFYGQCWSWRGDETDATWRIYAAGKKRGARVRVRTGGLLQVISQGHAVHNVTCFVGRVEYKPAQEIRDLLTGHSASQYVLDPTGRGQALSLLLKRLEFEHEAEVRVLYNAVSTAPGLPLLKTFPVDPNHLLEEIVLDPRLSPKRCDRISAELHRAGYQGSVRQSDLYRLPGPATIDLDA
jgi:hypothetical protein